MTPELESFIIQNETPEAADVLTAAQRTFDRIGAVGYDERFRELLETSEILEMGGTIIAIRNLTQDIQIELLCQQGVIPESDCSLEQLDLLLNGLLDIQNYEVFVEITDCVQDGNSTEESLALMLELVTPWPSETLYQLLDSVSDGCIRRIQAIGKEQLYNGIAVEQEAPVLDEQAETLRRYSRFLDRKDLLVLELISTGLRLGYPLAIYLRTYGNEVAGLEPRQCAEELIGLALVSSDAQSTPREAIKEVLDQFVSSLDQITRIDAAIKDTLLRFERYEKA